MTAYSMTFPLPPILKLPSGLGDGHDIQVSPGAEPPVQLELLAAEILSFLQGSVIEIAQVHGLLGLIRIFAREKNEGHLCLHKLNAGRRLRVSRGLRAKPAHREAVVKSWAHDILTGLLAYFTSGHVGGTGGATIPGGQNTRHMGYNLVHPRVQGERDDK